MLMGFPRGYTTQCCPKGQRQGSTWLDERMSLIGNSWCVFVIAWLLYCLGVARDEPVVRVEVPLFRHFHASTARKHSAPR